VPSGEIEVLLVLALLQVQVVEVMVSVASVSPCFSATACE
jgi:hypothetical protein